MQHAILCDGPVLRLERWGGGLSYALTCKPRGEGVFVQGDGALQFEAELEAAELAFPNLTAEEIAAWLWDQCGYELAAQPTQED